MQTLRTLTFRGNSDRIDDVQKMARPENWEVLRPYAEKLLERVISATYEESAIAEDRKQLRDLFTREKEIAQRVRDQAKDLFTALNVPQPYEAEVDQPPGCLGGPFQRR